MIKDIFFNEALFMRFFGVIVLFSLFSSKKSALFEWYKRFKVKKEGVKDDKRYGRLETYRLLQKN